MMIIKVMMMMMMMRRRRRRRMLMMMMMMMRRRMMLMMMMINNKHDHEANLEKQLEGGCIGTKCPRRSYRCDPPCALPCLPSKNLSKDYVKYC